MKNFLSVLAVIIVSGALAGGVFYYLAEKKIEDSKDSLASQIDNLNKKVEGDTIEDDSKVTEDANQDIGSNGNQNSNVNNNSNSNTNVNTNSSNQNLSLANLRSATYTIDGASYTLVNGVYEKGTKQVYIDTTYVGYNSTNQDQVAIIIKSTNDDKAIFRHLVVMSAKDGKPKQIAEKLLGDKLLVRGLTMNASTISVRELTYAASDPEGKPSIDKTYIYKLNTDKLVLQ
ncbi:MAG: hypothetical protein WC107_02250 [Patescibacteria group bacterium]